MGLAVLARFWKRNKPSARTSRQRLAATYYRPRVRGFEERIVPSTFVPAVFGPPVSGPAQLAPVAPVSSVNTVLPLHITGVQVGNGALRAVGTLGGINFSTPLGLTASPNAADPTCPILNLHLAPIHLNVLGLKVDTSSICLKITAQSGSGNLLGNLLCNVANLLNQGTPLSSILSSLTSTQMHLLTTDVTSMLNRVMHKVTTPAPSALHQLVSVGSSAGASCNVLKLTLGPVDLNLLGLDVHLDNCNNGPLMVRITAVPGAGNLLGNLICDLSNLLNSGATTTALENSLGSIAGAIQSLI